MYHSSFDFETVRHCRRFVCLQIVRPHRSYDPLNGGSRERSRVVMLDGDYRTYMAVGAFGDTSQDAYDHATQRMSQVGIAPRHDRNPCWIDRATGLPGKLTTP